MSVNLPHPDPSTDAWIALRALLADGSRPLSQLSDEVASAAMLGEVESLAVAAEPALAPWLQDAAERREMQATLVAFAEARVLEVLEAASVDSWAALKGSATAHLLYDDPTLRPRRDVDILIERRDMPALMAAATAAGWQEVTHPRKLVSAPEGPYEREYVIPIDVAQVGCDVHSRVLRWREFPVDVSELLARGRCLESGWRVCGLPDLLVHTALHSANAAFIVPLRSWLDVHLLATSPGLDWDATLRCATAWRARRCLWAALHVAQRWFGTTVPDEVLTVLQPRGVGAARLVGALEGQGRWAATQVATGRLDRARTRLLVRESAAAAVHYMWQTGARELAMWVSRGRP